MIIIIIIIIIIMHLSNYSVSVVQWLARLTTNPLTRVPSRMRAIGAQHT